MKLNKIFIFGLVATLGLAACSDDEDYTSGAPRTENAPGINFEQNPSSLSLGIADEELTLTVSRENTDGALSVPLIVSATVDGIFTVPATAEFADGAADTEITVKVSDKTELMKEYKLFISVPESFYDQYGVDAPAPNFAITVLRNDFKVVATGTYVGGFFDDEEWPQDLEYSEALDRYRFTELWYPGSGFQFTWDKETNVVAPCEDALVGFVSLDTNYLGWYTGIENYGSYGPVYAQPAKYASGAWAYQYVPSADAFAFIHFWKVGAGSFGDFQDVFYVENWLDSEE